MRRLRATRMLALAIVVLALAAGSVAAVAATRGGDDGPRRATAQEQTATPAPKAKAWLGVSVKQSDKPAASRLSMSWPTVRRQASAWSEAT